MNLIIRKMAHEDAAAIAMLSHQLGYFLSEEQTLQNIAAVTANKDSDAFVVIHEKQVVGWIGISLAIQIESPPFCEIRGLVVDEKYRKMGIGKMLIEKAIQWCREKGNNTIRLRCNVKRSEAHLFYRHLGFKETKEQKVFELKADH
jgi:GNAT superfamily N-acetyltransferase